MNPRMSPARRRGYTLIEVMAAAAVISTGMAAAVSLTSSLMLQEELAWRTAVTRNYQENMARLWQLGLSYTGKDATNVGAVMPSQQYSPKLNEALNAATLIETGDVNPEELGELDEAIVTASPNISSDPRAEKQGASFSIYVYRPALIADLRTEALNK